MKTKHKQDVQRAHQGQEIVVFTFSMGETEYAVPLHEILAVNPMPESWVNLPLGTSGAARVIEHRGQPTEMIDFAEYLGVRSSSDLKLETADLLDQREKDHVAWLAALEDSIREGTPFAKARNPHECAFGKWYDTYTTRDAALKEIMSNFAEPHKRIHSLADRLLGLAEQGRTEEALSELEFERNSTLAQMCNIFEAARYQLRRMARRVVLFLTLDGTTPALGLALDEINDVRSFHPDDLQSIDRAGSVLHGNLDEVFAGIFLTEEGRACVLLNTAALL